MAQQVWDIIVVGGGAAGFFAALSAKERNPDLRIMILESSATPLAKVKISGGGRCNVTHACYEPRELITHYPRSHRQLRENFRQFGPKDVVQWFESRGVALKTESDGRIFPTSDRSQTVIDCLLKETRKCSVELRTGTPVSHIEKRGGENEPEFLVTVKNQTSPECARAVVLATGGAVSGYRLVAGLGHETIAPSPSLFTFCVEDAELTALSGVSVPKVSGQLMFPKGEPISQDGPLLITHWGLSGPCILKLSAWGARELHEANYQIDLLLDWFPDQHAEALRLELLALKETHAKKQLKNCPSALPQRLWCYLLSKAGFDVEETLAAVKNKTLNIFSEKLKRWPIRVSGKGPFKEEFVTAGGVNLNDVDMTTYESRICKGLYVTGELLNIDGVTGGFNFQNAWTSGYVSGSAIAEHLLSLKKPVS